MPLSRLLVGERRDSALAILIISSVLWGSSFVSVKIGLAYVNVFVFLFFRLFIASAILFVALIVLGGHKATSIKRPLVWVLGLLNGFAFSLQYLGLLFTTPAHTALLVDLNVVIVALLSWKMFGESFGLRKRFGVSLGVIGAVLVTTNGNLQTLGQGTLLGDFLVFCAGLVWAFFIVMHKPLLQGGDGNVIDLSFTVLLATSVVLLPGALVFGAGDMLRIPALGWWWIIFMATALTLVPYGLWVLAMKAVSATIATVVGLLEIVTAMILSSILFGESYSNVILAGAAMILFSIIAVAQS